MGQNALCHTQTNFCSPARINHACSTLGPAPNHTEENRPLSSTHHKRFYRWQALNQRRMNYPPAVSLTPTTETNTVQGIIDSTLKRLQNSANFPESAHHLKTKLNTYEEKLHAGDPHITSRPSRAT